MCGTVPALAPRRCGGTPPTDQTSGGTTPPADQASGGTATGGTTDQTAPGAPGGSAAPEGVPVLGGQGANPSVGSRGPANPKPAH